MGIQTETYMIAPPWPPAPRQPMKIMALGVAASRKPSSEIGVGLPNFLLRLRDVAGCLGLRYSFSKVSRGMGSSTLSAVCILRRSASLISGFSESLDMVSVCRQKLS